MTAQPLDVHPSVRQALGAVYDPCCRDKGISIVDMGLLHRASIDGGEARVELLLTSGWCPFASTVEQAVRRIPGVENASVTVVWDEAWSPARLSENAREKLRFLPDPKAVSDPASYVATNWQAPQREDVS
jgi:metal-sulfur cluster biosynthetic enzyme